jgi:hypothetical protein
MNHNETALGGDSVIRWIDQGDGRLMRTENESTVPSTGTKSRQKVVGRR